MFTPTIGEVKTAIRRNQLQEAAQLLEKVIQEKPSAEAWYLASTLTNDRDQKIYYLRTALLMDRKHHKSRSVLRDMGVDLKSSSTTMMLQNLVHLWQEQANSSFLLRYFPPIVQNMVGMAVVVLIFAMFALLFVQLSPSGPDLSNTGPLVENAEFNSTTHIVDAFTQGTLDILSVNLSRNEQVGKDIVQLDVRDLGNRSLRLEVYIYDSVQGILQEQTMLSAYEQTNTILAHANIIVLYPQDMSSTTAEAINAIVDTQIISGGA